MKMNLLLIASLFIADTVVYPLPPEKVDPSTVAVTNEFRGAWWNKPYHERYRILVDFDFDGHDDMLLSEPMADFGTGGGCWTAYHWTNGLYQAMGSFGAHYAAAAQPALCRNRPTLICAGSGNETQRNGEKLALQIVRFRGKTY